MDDDAPPGVPEWVVTYGDMMSLLLTFFIMLVSMSELKQDGKLRELLNALQARFGPAAAAAVAPGPTAAERNALTQSAADGAAGSAGVGKTRRDAAGRDGRHEGAAETPPDALPALAGPAAFGQFSAAVLPTAGPTLDALAAAVRQAGGEVIVRGHASPEPLPADAPHADAWALAQARAATVAGELVARGVAADRVRVESAGASEPPAGWGGRIGGAGDPRAWDRVDVLLGEN